MKTPRFATIDLNEVALDNLEPIEIGVYALLLKACFANNGKLRVDSKLKFFAKTSSHIWNRVWPKISNLFYEDNEKNLRSRVVDFRLERVEHISKERSEAAHARHAKARAIALQMDMQLHPKKPPKPDAFARVKTENISFPLPSETHTLRPRASRRPKVEGQKVKGVFGADPSARNGHATTERSSTPGFKQVRPSHITPATANLMSQCARFLGEDKATQFWSDMMSPEASTVLSNTAKAMRDSGWKDPG